MKAIVRAVLLAAVAPLVLGMIGVGWGMWQFNRPPFDLALLQQLQPGMSRAQVRQIIGAPTSVHDGTWAYQRRLAWPIAYVQFDESGRLTKRWYDY